MMHGHMNLKPESIRNSYYSFDTHQVTSSVTQYLKNETNLNSNKSKCNQNFYFPSWEDGHPTEFRKRTNYIIFIKLSPPNPQDLEQSA